MLDTGIQGIGDVSKMTTIVVTGGRTFGNLTVDITTHNCKQEAKRLELLVKEFTP